MIYKIICIIALSLLGMSHRAQAENATTLLDKASQAYEKSGGISATFAVSVYGSEGQTDNVSGTIDMKGEKFVLVTPEVHTWFDGTTQWVYMTHSEEVNVSNPSGEELQAINPILLLKSYQTGFAVSYNGESTGSEGKTVVNIHMIPKQKSEVKKINLQIEKNSSLPAGIDIVNKNGTQTKIRISKLKTGMNQPDSFFVFKESSYPDAEIIDLR